MTHQWEEIGAVQWGALGLPHDAARSDWKCKQCGALFSHFYHVTPSIYEAMEKIPETCYPVQWEALVEVKQ